MAKGSKRDRWLKDGIKQSKKVYKKIMNRKVRNTDPSGLNNCGYKKLLGEKAYDMVLWQVAHAWITSNMDGTSISKALNTLWRSSIRLNHNS